MIGCAQKELFRLLVVFVNRPAVGPAQLDCMGNDSRQHGFKVECGADRLTNFAQCFQLTDRLHQLPRPCFQFLEQPHVLDSDDGLVSVGFEKLDLGRSERAYLVAPSGQCSDRFPLWAEGDAQKGAESGKHAQAWKIVLRSADVWNVERAMLVHPAKPWLINTHLDSPNGYEYRAKMSPCHQTFPFKESRRNIVNPTNRDSAVDDRIEHRLHVRRRAADDSQHLGGSRLMLQRLAQFCIALLDFFEQTDVFDCDDRL